MTKTPFRNTVSCRTGMIVVIAVMLTSVIPVEINCGIAIAQGTTQRDNSPAEVKHELKKFRIDFIPNNALAVLAIRPAEILAQKMVEPARDLFIQDVQKHEIDGFLGFSPFDIETMTVIYFIPEQGERERFAMVIQTKQKIDRKPVIEKFSKKIPVDSKVIGKKYLKLSNPSGKSLLFLDDHTLVTSKNEKDIQQVIDALYKNKPNGWANQWQQIEQALVAGIYDVRKTREIIGDQRKPQFFERPPFAQLRPILENSNVVTFSLTINQKISIKSTLYQKKNGESIKNALDSFLIFLTNTLNQTLQKINQSNTPSAVKWGSIVKHYIKILKSIEISQKGEDVSLSLLVPDDSGTQMIAMLAPAINSAREAARRSKARNNLKRLGLALHLYHDEHSQFPPAIVIGPDGKTPHSWRVELLPYLDQTELYKEYKMDQPWDSEHNKKVLSKMPAVFRNPNDDGPANNTSYFAVVGKNTLFGKKEGARIQDITDGTSNTIAIVEAKRNIPWTKPEDIQYDRKKAPKFGGFHKGGFQVLFCDGSARFVSESVDKELLKNLIEINDGNMVR